MPMHEADFLNVIEAHPTDPAPRLIYADWLDEQGDPRGELLRIQEELRRIEVPHRQTKEARMQELLNAGVNPLMITRENSLGIRFVLIFPGEFLMGGDQSAEEVARIAGGFAKSEYFTDQYPQHRVRISRPFYLGIYEVTQGEWESVLGSNPSWFSAGGDGQDDVANLDTSRFPVENVSWFDAIEYCNKLSRRESLPLYYGLTDVERNEDHVNAATVSVSGGSGYRLPTEAEWEYACRAGTTTPFHFGTTNDGQAANVDGNYPYGTSIKGPYLERTTNVGSYAPNSFGLFDVHGNTWEWCLDGYDETAYQGRTELISDPIVTNVRDRRVLRGGSWSSSARYTRSADRNRDTPGVRYGSIGFRVARTP